MRIAKILLLTALVSSCAESDPNDDGNLRTFVIPFSPELGGERIACGPTYSGAGISGSTFELKDFLVFVHDVQLVRSNGERVPLDLVEDQQWQGQDVALLDFNDATSRCMGDPETNDRVVGTAPDHDDYVGIVFDIGLPPELNHLDAVTAAPPLNKPSTWWGWTEGYKFFQLTMATPVHEDFYVHIGATHCEGTVEDGFSCVADHEITIEIADFVPGTDGVRLNIATLLSEVDLEAPVDFDAGDFVAGCMSFDPDAECDAIFSKLGAQFVSGDPGPPQIVFEPAGGMAAAIEDPGDIDDTLQPGHPDFPRDPSLNVENESMRGGTTSHPPGDVYAIGSRTYARGPGAQCLFCHQEKGPGLGVFEVGGTIWEADGVTTYPEATIKLLRIDAGPCLEGDTREHCIDQPLGFFREEDVVATLQTDARGTAFTTALPEGAQPPFWPVVVPAEGDGLATKFMPFPAASGACNMCHGGLKIRLEAAE